MLGMKVKNVIIINKLIVFEPDKNRLTSLKDYPERNISLHAPVSACLLLLLQHNHQPVTQKYLFSEVWEKNGAIVSTNAIYQSIALIRKALRGVGLDEEIIFTLPKIGFKAEAHVVTIPFDEFMTARTARQVAVPVELSPPATAAKKMYSRVIFFSELYSYHFLVAYFYYFSFSTHISMKTLFMLIT